MGAVEPVGGVAYGGTTTDAGFTGTAEGNARPFVSSDALAVLDALGDPVVVYAPVYGPEASADASGRSRERAPIDFVCVYANDVARKVMVEYGRELVGMASLANWPGMAETPVYAAIARVAVTGKLEVVRDANRDHRLPVHADMKPDAERLFEGGGSHFDAWVSQTGPFVSVVWRDVTERARAEAKFRTLAEHASDAVSVVNRGGYVEWTSPSVLDVLGYTPDEMVGTRPFEKFHPDDLATAVASGAATAQELDTVSFRGRFEKADGEYLWLDVRITTVRDIAGNVRYRVAATRDIHDEMMMLEELVRSRELYARLAGHVSDLVFEVDADDVVQWCSPAAEHLLGVPVDALVGSRFVTHHHPSEHADILASVARATNGEITSGQRCRVLGSDGEYRWVSRRSQPVLGADGTVTSIVVTLSDASSEVAAHDALVRSEERYRMLADRADLRYADLVARMHDGVWAIDEAGVTTFANPAMAGMLGTSVDELVGTSVLDWMDPEDRPLALMHLTRRVRGESGEHEFRFRRSDGRELWTLVAATPRLLDGEFQDAFAVVTDITALKAAQASADAARDAADAANRAKTDFLARMSHELRTPLHVILGFASLATPTQDPAVQRYAAEVDAAGRHLLRLIDDLLDVTRIEAQGLTLQLAPVNVAEALRTAVGLTTPAFPATEITVECPDDLWALADRDRLVQVVVNLAGNGARHGRQGTPVWVQATAGPEDLSDAGLRDPDGGPVVYVAVTSAGVSIAPEDKQRIFEPFVQLAGGDGVGLGLSVCAGLVEAMGGKIGVVSSDTHTVFWFTLPAAPTPQE